MGGASSTLTITIRAIDNASKTFANIKKQLDSIGKTASSMSAVAATLKQMGSAASSFKKEGAGMSSLLKDTSKQLGAFASQADAAAARVKGLFGQMKIPQMKMPSLPTIKAGGMFDGIKSGLLDIGKIAAGVLGADLLKKAVGGITDFAKDAFMLNGTLEKTTLQFTTLMGSADEAAAHVKDLFDFAAKTPFESGEVIAASKNLLTFGGKALDTTKNLTMVGNAAAAVGQNIQEVSFWTGRAYSMIQGGQPFGEAAMRLQEMGILTASTRAEMEKMQKQGKSGAEVWGYFTQSMDRFNGAMKLQESTWEGLTSTIKDNLTMAGSKALKPFFDLTKEGMTQLSAFLQTDMFTGWADKAAGAFTGIIGLIKGLASGDITGAFLSLAQGVGAAFGPDAIGPVFAFKKTMLGLIGAVKNIFAAFKSGNVPNILEALGLGQFTGPVMQAISALQQFGGIVATVGGAIMSVLAPAFQTLVSGVMSAWPQLQAAFGAIGQLLTALAPVIGGIVVGLIGLITGLFSGIASAVGPFISTIAGTIAGLATAFTGIVNVVSGIFQAIYGIFTGNGDLIQSAWSQMLTGLGQIFSGFDAAAKAWFGGLFNTLLSFVSGFVSGVTGFFGTLLPGLQPAIAGVGAFIQGALVPAFSQLWGWLQTILPAAVQTLSGFFAGTLQPALDQAGGFIQGTLIPVFAGIWNWLATSIPQAISTVSGVFTGVLIPALTAAWGWISANLLPLLGALANVIGAGINLALTAMAGIWQNVLLPAITTVANIIGTVLNVALSAMAAIWAGVVLPPLLQVIGVIQSSLTPVLQTLGGIAEEVGGYVGSKLAGGFDAVAAAIQAVIGWLNDLAGMLKNIKLPSWMTPGSPTPWEIGLIGVTDAMKALSGVGLPQLQAAMVMPAPAFTGNYSNAGAGIGGAAYSAPSATVQKAEKPPVNITIQIYGGGPDTAQQARTGVLDAMRAAGMI